MITASAATIPPVPRQYRDAATAARIARIASSFELLFGRPLTAIGGDVVESLWRAPVAIVAHGTEADPIFFFGNAAALAAFDYDVETFVTTPSRLSAEAPQRDERQALLDRVSDHGFIDDYSGVRITRSGKRFSIERAIVWNLVDGEGRCHGQAATFAP